MILNIKELLDTPVGLSYFDENIKKLTIESDSRWCIFVEDYDGGYRVYGVGGHGVTQDGNLSVHNKDIYTWSTLEDALSIARGLKQIYDKFEKFPTMEEILNKEKSC